MKLHRLVPVCSITLSFVLISSCQSVPGTSGTASLDSKDFKQWILPPEAPSPDDNKATPARVELGKMLFFDPRLSRDNNTACVSCHSPSFGWSDPSPVSIGFHGKPMAHASMTIVNVGYNTHFMWDGRNTRLEDQALIPMKNPAIMNTDLDKFFKWASVNPGYQTAFAKAYPGEPVGPETLSKAIAVFERSVVRRDSPFDRWVSGEKDAMTPQQLRGLAIFTDQNKGNCVVCHAAPNFTDNGFHNVGLASFGAEKPDMGRYTRKPIAVLKGAFKTPTLREVEFTAPYFHDGSAKTLMDVVEHYSRGGEVKTNLSPNMKPLNLSQAEKEDLVAFLRALSGPFQSVAYPALPQD